ncbi:Phosphotyrosyl phosphatase activator [Pseudoloma neurophilia]|uniref:Serine/threonine-protein phosphatase 2A activator n=1 Tax=Pseudoloma neurophilia TaxID=146866 RepID=A0A0R0LYM5_9MICR|nr:Phosphotyrosyl phosphatase activator [Pseudoloma neurophilia]
MLDRKPFTDTTAYFRLTGFLEDINDYLISSEPLYYDSKKYDSDGEKGKSSQIYCVLNRIEKFIISTELDPGTPRFANMAAIKVHEYLEEMVLAEELTGLSQSTNDSLDKEDKTKFDSLKLYLSSSFGNKSRLDYGTGHEINFLSFLYLCRLFYRIDNKQTVRLFKYYFNIIRLFINKFNIEPAGSNGMFSVDDYSFLPVLFGAAELVNSDIYFDDLITVQTTARTSLGSPVQSSVRTSLGSPVQSSVRTSLGSPVQSPARTSLGSPVQSPARTSLGSPVQSSVRTSLGSPVQSPVRTSLGSPVGHIHAVDAQINENHKNLIYSEMLQFCILHKSKGNLSFKKHSRKIYELRNQAWSSINQFMLNEIYNKVFGRQLVMQHFPYCKYLPEE